MQISLISRYETFRPFSEQEAWSVYRFAAFAEAFGWTLLICGIGISSYVFPGDRNAVVFAGRSHGIFFGLYIIATLVMYPSLRWSRGKALVAAAASLPPFGSLMFEQWAAYKRRSAALKDYRKLSVRALIQQKNKLLVVELKHGKTWELPGGQVLAGETAEQALGRLVSLQTGVTPTLGQLQHTKQFQTGGAEQLELYFKVSNAGDFKESALKKFALSSDHVDNITFTHDSAIVQA